MPKRWGSNKYQNLNDVIKKMKFNIMRPVQSLVNSLAQQGLRTTIFKFYILIIDFYFDIKYGTDTSKWTKLDDLTIESDNKERGVNYQATRVIPLRKLFNNIKLMIPADSLFVDFGCGKGRVLLIASQFGFREVRGVEFSHELCEIAKNNCAVYKAKMAVRTEFKIIESDVVNYVINTDENVFFMYHPFDEVVLRKVLNNIATSLKIQPRRTVIIYFNPKYGNFIEQHDNFVRSGDFVLWGYNFTVYSNSDNIRILTCKKQEDSIMSNGQERRKYKRIEKPYVARLRIKQYKGLERPSAEWDMVAVKDLSAGGMRFNYNKNLELDSLLDLKIDFFKSIPVINCFGIVVRVEEPQLNSRFRIAAKFIEIDEQEREMINKTIEEILE